MRADAREAMSSTLTYAEVRQWIVWLRAFTISQMADTLGVDERAVEPLVELVAHDIYGIIEDTGVRLNGSGPAEVLYRWKPLPPGPNVHETGPLPERSTAGCYELAPVRGMPIRMVDEDRKRASTPGERHKMVMRQRRWEEQQQAKLAAAEAARRRKQALYQSGRHEDRMKILRQQGHVK